ncbi:hypothetical protein [Veronia pacifica]|uniref:Uncharacterized protein n=1 Tax=Veronia pacifica TaxID=1080227 RepID=A0A1C3ED11_9GAMM|nr:hypothetical protein [Veronia pacifica]ODA31119.1 hypothetical protein A8L45_18265 [Veronia pacifica]
MDLFTFAVVIIAILSGTKVIQTVFQSIFASRSRPDEQRQFDEKMSALKDEHQQELAALRERVEVLEKIVTEKSYRLE